MSDREMVVVKKIYRVDSNGQRMVPPPGFELAWHGTKEEYVCSILKHGLRASGSKLPDGKLLKPLDNHYALGMSHQGISNWAAAVFVSPSVSYASHVCYAERVFVDGEMWAVIMDCAVRKGSFTKHDQTVGGGYSGLPGEPENAEYRVQVRDSCDEQIWRAKQHDDVCVLGCTLILVSFLELSGLTYQQMRKLVGEELYRV